VTKPTVIEAHTYPNDSNLPAGVYPQQPDRYEHVLVVGDNGRKFSVGDMFGFIDFGGIHVSDPDHLDDLAARIHRLAALMRDRQGSDADQPPNRHPLVLAEAAGWRAYVEGRPAAPGADPVVRSLIDGLPVGGGAAAIMRAFTRGRDSAASAACTAAGLPA
jgi:hypothetical protein